MQPMSEHAAGDSDRALPSGLPVYDVNGKVVGKTGGQPNLADGLALHRGTLLHQHATIPLHMVQRIETDGVYLNRTHQEIEDLARGGWSNLGERDLVTGVPAGQDVGIMPTFPDGNNAAGASTSTGITTGLPHDDDEQARRTEYDEQPGRRLAPAGGSSEPLTPRPQTTASPVSQPPAPGVLPPTGRRPVREVIIDPDEEQPREGTPS